MRWEGGGVKKLHCTHLYLSLCTQGWSWIQSRSRGLVSSRSMVSGPQWIPCPNWLSRGKQCYYGSDWEENRISYLAWPDKIFRKLVTELSGPPWPKTRLLKADPSDYKRIVWKLCINGCSRWKLGGTSLQSVYWSIYARLWEECC